MGIYCETDIQTPPDGYFVPGSSVAGVIRYTTDEDTQIENIILSLKGTGKLTVVRSKSNNDSTTYVGDEEYVNIVNVVKFADSGRESSAQQYECNFSFVLPYNIPSSLKYRKGILHYKADCKITYSIQAKFIVPGKWSFNKKFAKEIQVVSTKITPKHHMKPNIHGQRRKLFQPFSKLQGFVNLKATIQSSIILPGGKVDVTYEVQNSTNVAISAIKTKFVEICDFYAHENHIVEMYHLVEDLKSKTGAVNSGDTFELRCDITVPPELHSIDNSKIVVRNYGFLIEVKMPAPYRNLRLRIPIQIGDPINITEVSEQGLELENPVKIGNVLDANQFTEAAGTFYDPPPSYVESMNATKSPSYNEDSEDKLEFSDDHEENGDSSDDNYSIKTDKSFYKK